MQPIPIPIESLTELTKTPEGENPSGVFALARVRAPHPVCARCGSILTSSHRNTVTYCSRQCLNLQKSEEELKRRVPIIEGDIARVPLSNGQFAMVDAEDADLVSKY